MSTVAEIHREYQRSQVRILSFRPCQVCLNKFSSSSYRASELLDETEHEYRAKGETAWLEAALCSLVHDIEVEAEAKDVGLAMEASLQEKEDLEKSRPSLSDSSMKTVLTLYSDKSPIANVLLALHQNHNLIIDTKLLIDWLDFEQGCHRWYPMASKGYFNDLSQKILAMESPEKLECFLLTTMGDLKTEVFSYPLNRGGMPPSFLPYESDEIICLDAVQ